MLYISEQPEDAKSSNGHFYRHEDLCPASPRHVYYARRTSRESVRSCRGIKTIGGGGYLGDAWVRLYGAEEAFKGASILTVRARDALLSESCISGCELEGSITNSLSSMAVLPKEMKNKP